MHGHGEKLTRRRDQAVVALLREPTIGEAARAIGVGEATLGRWLQDDDFRTAYQDACRQLFDHTLAELQRATNEAVQTLVRTLRCGTPSVELKAAEGVLRWADRAVELADIQERLKILEMQLGYRESA